MIQYSPRGIPLVSKLVQALCCEVGSLTCIEYCIGFLEASLWLNRNTCTMASECCAYSTLEKFLEGMVWCLIPLRLLAGLFNQQQQQ